MRMHVWLLLMLLLLLLFNVSSSQLAFYCRIEKKNLRLFKGRT
jgi:hypothetical protein